MNDGKTYRVIQKGVDEGLHLTIPDEVSGEVKVSVPVVGDVVQLTAEGAAWCLMMGYVEETVDETPSAPRLKPSRRAIAHG